MFQTDEKYKLTNSKSLTTRAKNSKKVLFHQGTTKSNSLKPDIKKNLKRSQRNTEREKTFTDHLSSRIYRDLLKLKTKNNLIKLGKGYFSKGDT